MDGPPVQLPVAPQDFEAVDGVEADVDEWEHELDRLPPLDQANCKEYERVLDLYTGDYLGDLEYLWAEPERARLRRRWLDCARLLEEFYVREGRETDTMRIHHHILQRDPGNENSYFVLMKLYAGHGDAEDVKNCMKR